MATVRLENINKRYDNGAFAVIDFNLEINDREFLVLVGPSGCGKSTTLRMIAGLEEITTGSIYIDDTCVNNLPPKDRDISMVFQNYALYPHMTVYENLAFGLRLRKTPKKEIASRVDEAAAILGLGDFLKRIPKQMSGGQRQRVALGGEIQPVSDPVSLYNTPENTFVAGFIGTPPMNLVAGGLVNRGGILGFRPESVTVLNKGDPAEKVIRCIIDFIEPMGCETYLHLNLSGKKVVARVPPENRYKCGDVIGLKIDFDKASFFNETTGKRVREKEVRECESA
jgi:ABC-type sugar transport system ATPase subunit